MQAHPVVSRDEWLIKRRALLAREKEAIHLRDAINAERQALPWVKVDTEYEFDSPEGKKTLAELFDGRSQLMVYHFMLGPDWGAGCPGCSFLSDHIGGMLTHLNHHDVTFVAVSRAPIDKIAAYKKRMGWQFPWVSSFGSTFNHDYRVSFSQGELASGSVDYNYTATPREEAHDELPGMSAFYQDEARNVFHTYSTYARGLEDMVGTLLLLDRAPLGRNENGPMSWVRRHDEYEDAPKAHGCCAK
ncbi:MULTISPECIES: thioredoxin family protein [Ralstonia]|jgi:predicted dithiol-disulfide oxidoreductase (DUF899 family)|uniref:Thioredoxin domain-containing protein n=1 Tax=Ralstonia pickettii OR214 TaxID=1264675 RepID=R0CDB7_RALPI|nr:MULTISPECIES: thioredoxin family protein [Ralstonia]MEA3269869.1 thioredoxin family protein [Pseudomonadota bacterium]ENZ74946.1 hypothetical protein OR214_05108 [Ralstonia pickettii OR214]MBL4778447.1 thioredoxin family protein [Ralstonia sp.]MCM3581616.1 thioredoxin family protein [Ralstonia pickettii]OYU24953.1 MAG: thioredoxin [Ralstonia sp. PBBBR1]